MEANNNIQPPIVGNHNVNQPAVRNNEVDNICERLIDVLNVRHRNYLNTRYAPAVRKVRQKLIEEADRGVRSAVFTYQFFDDGYIELDKLARILTEKYDGISFIYEHMIPNIEVCISVTW